MMDRIGNVLKTKVLGGVLVAGIALPMAAMAQNRCAPQQFQPVEYRDGYSGYGNNGYYGGNGYASGGYYNNGGSYNNGDYRDYNRHHGVGPGTGALIGAGAGALLGGILGGGKGALIGGGVGAGVGAAAGAANRNSQRDAWNRGYNGYGYSNNGYGHGGPYRRY